jgi:hypothetical protein
MADPAAEALLALCSAQGREYAPKNRPEISAEFIRALLLELPFTAAWHQDTARKQRAYQTFAAAVPANSSAPVPITAAGVRIKGVRIVGPLDLADCLGAGGQGLPALAIEESEFAVDPVKHKGAACLNIAHARLARLSLRGSRLHKVHGRECLIDGPLELSACTPIAGHDSIRPGIDREQWKNWLHERRWYLLQCVWSSLGKVPVPGPERAGPKPGPPLKKADRREKQCWFDFRGARIDGEVRADALSASAPDGSYALDLSDCEVLGSIEIGTLRDGQDPHTRVRAELIGGLLLDAAVVRGALWVDGALMVSSGPHCAVRAQGARVDGLVALSGGFTSYGCVRFQQAHIGGSLQIEEATLDGAGGDEALIADGMVVGADVLIRGDVATRGALSMRNATIAGDLALSGAVLDGGGGRALEASSIEVRGAVQMRKHFTAQGRVVFAGARIAGRCDFSTATLMSSDDGPALNAENAIIGGDVFLRFGFVAAGGVRLVGARIDQDLEIREATLQGRSDSPGSNVTALDGGGMSIRGRIWLEDNTIYGDIDLKNASATVLRDSQSGYPAHDPGCAVQASLELDGFVYQRLHDTWQQDAVSAWRNRVPWLERMRRFAPQPYAQLARVLEQQGLHDAALAVEEKARRREQEESARRIRLSQAAATKLSHKFRTTSWLVWGANWLFGLGFGYGLKPRRAVVVLIASLLLGWGGFAYLHWRGAMVIDQMAVAAASDGGEMGAPASEMGVRVNSAIRCTNQIRPSLYAVDVFVPLVDLRQESQCVVGASEEFGDGIRALRIPDGIWLVGGKYVIHELDFYYYLKALYSIFGWIISSLSILTFSGAFRQRGLMRG